MDPADPILRYNLAAFLHDEEDLDAARIEYLHVLQLAPDYVPALFNLASVLVDLGDCEAAIGHLEHVLETAPDFVAAEELLEKAREGAARDASTSPRFD